MLNKTGRRWLRIVHLVFITFIMGGLLSILAISLVDDLDPSQLFIANYLMYFLFNSVVTYSFYGVVTTGLVYSVFTHWGLTKHWWIIGKWVGTLTVFTLVWVWLGPAVTGMVALSDAGLENAPDNFAYHELAQNVFPSILTALGIFITLITITIFRPWGQRKQTYTLKRATILTLTGFTVFVSVGFGVLGYFDLESYRNLEIDSPELQKIPDGTYRGSSSYAGFEYIVELKVLAHTITEIDIIENRDSPYASYAEGIVPRILNSQSPEVDGITGATTTSKILMMAIQVALEGAEK